MSIDKKDDAEKKKALLVELDLLKNSFPKKLNQFDHRKSFLYKQSLIKAWAVKKSNALKSIQDALDNLKAFY